VIFFLAYVMAAAILRRDLVGEGPARPSPASNPDGPALVEPALEPRSMLVSALGIALPSYARAWLVHDQQRVLKRAPAFRALGMDGVHPQHTLVTEESIARWKRRPALVNTWTVNAPEDVRRVTALGVDAVISDDPGAALRAISA
jgi:hypothetical protein